MTKINARYRAISGIGYGQHCDTPQEAVESYVRSMMRDVKAANTIYDTKPKWEAALRSGDAKPIVWLVPEGATGFFLDSSVHWTWPDGKHQKAELSERVFTAPVGAVINEAIQDVNDVIGFNDRDLDRFNLLGNVVEFRLLFPDSTVEECVKNMYGEDVETVLGWSA